MIVSVPLHVTYSQRTNSSTFSNYVIQGVS